MDNKEIRLLLRGLSFDFMEIPPCTFIMGSSPNECWHRNDELLHSVTLTEKFWIGKKPVSVAQYNRITGTACKDDKEPYKVNWYEAQKFCDILNEHYADFLQSGYMFALPTEAQWECACRASIDTTKIENILKELYDMEEHHKALCKRLYNRSGIENLLPPMRFRQEYEIEKLAYEAIEKIRDMYQLFQTDWLEYAEWCRDWYENEYASDPEFLTRNRGKEKIVRGMGSIKHTWWWSKRSYPELHDCSRIAKRDKCDPQNDVAAFRIAIVPMYRCASPEKQHNTKQVKNKINEDKLLGIEFNEDETILIKFPNDFPNSNYEVPLGVTEIGCGAFASLKELNPPQSGVSMCMVVPMGIPQLKTIHIPSGVKLIGKDAFAGCTGLKKIHLPNTVFQIGSYAFELCSNLDTIEMSDNLFQIDSHAFRGCTSLTNINLPRNISVIEDSVFKECISLSKVIIPDGVKEIAGHAFEECHSLASIDIPESVTFISWYAFKGCRSLVKVNIPTKVTRISESLFEDCYNLQEVNIPYGVIEICAYAFKNCMKLKKINIPESVTTISANAFDGCVSLPIRELTN